MTHSPAPGAASVGRRAPRLAAVAPIALLCAALLPIPVARNSGAQPKPPAPPAGSDWPMAAKDYANTRYSELNQITTQNVKDLKLAWKFDTGSHRGQEAAPVVAANTMFVVTPCRTCSSAR